MGSTGKVLSRSGVAATILLGSIDIRSSYLQEGSFGIQTQRATGRLGGSLAGAAAGAEAGAAIGVLFGGWRAIPGGIIGGIAGGFGGSYLGDRTVTIIQQRQ